MLLIQSKSTDPYFNIAAEEYLLKNFSDNIFMLYVNEPSVIIGKHQNTLAEINYKYIKENAIKVVRRISGGGTVYHDFGNLNFCFIQKGEKEKLVDFRKFTKPILEVLNSLGVPAEFAGKSDLVIGNKKFSGNAEHVYQNKVMHHGTILYNSQIQNLSKALLSDPVKYTSNAVKSNRALVTTISEHLSTEMTLDGFILHFLEYFQQNNKNTVPYFFSNEDVLKINELIEKKYSTWDWNYGYSPKYTFRTSLSLFNEFFLMDVEKGIITNITLSTSTKEPPEILKKLVGIKHREKDIIEKLRIEIKEDTIFGMEIAQFAEMLF